MNTSLFKAKVAYIQLKSQGLSRVVDAPELVKFNSEYFINGTVVSPDETHFDHNKRIVIPLSEIATFTEFKEVGEIFKERLPKNSRNLKLLK